MKNGAVAAYVPPAMSADALKWSALYSSIIVRGASLFRLNEPAVRRYTSQLTSCLFVAIMPNVRAEVAELADALG